jgi:acyl-CoA synthetase (AMP-forming)/AMP-acid ligase II
MSLLAPFLDAARRHPDRSAIVERNGRRITYGELAAWSAGLAARFQARGATAGTRVLVAWPVSIELYAGLIALWRIGAVAVLPEAAMGLAGVRHAARTTSPAALLATPLIRAVLMLFAETRRIDRHLTMRQAYTPTPFLLPLPDTHPALISFTSGSTGEPKAMVRTIGLLTAQQSAISRLLAPKSATSTDLVWFPAFVLSTLALGLTAVLPDVALGRPESVDCVRLVRQIGRHGVRRLLIPPSVAARLVKNDSPPPLEAIFTGGGPVFPLLLRRLAEWARPAEVYAVYGSTEAEPIAHIAASQVGQSDFAAMQSGNGLLAGKPVPEIALRLLDEEILVAGPHVNDGYLDPAHDIGTKLRQDGRVWHRTGDLGRIDESGRLWLLGRRSGRVAGLHPFSVECAALSWPGVDGAALADIGGTPILALAGDASHIGDWRTRAAVLGVEKVRHLPRIPLDRRHNSKIDYAQLQRQLTQYR